ncbi:MAG TPA: hypothetical protein P5294_07125 [Smithellaceae bacterium]|nr:hypothetical protein [Smithellaceae bacterium]HRS89251.1 hypothetical protein [Smithellaceae bacterium]HRV26291.1 hypothetical protein [Smithellaceae bacterium]
MKNKKLRECGKVNNIICKLIFLFLFVFLLCGVAYALNPVKYSKETVSLLDDIAKGAVKNTMKHTDLLMKMGNKIDDFMPLMKKYPTQERYNILLEVMKQKDLVKSTEALVIKGKIAKGDIKEVELIKAIRSNKKMSYISNMSEDTITGKNKFYSVAHNELRTDGFKVINEEKLTKIGKHWKSRPDFVAQKKNRTYIGETKSPAEPPNSSSWRKVQKSDTAEFREVRERVAALEYSGEISKNEGGWMIIIKGQVEDYARKMGKTWDMPKDMKQSSKELYGALQVPLDQKNNVVKAFEHLKSSKMLKTKVDDIEIIEKGNSITFSWPLSNI